MGNPLMAALAPMLMARLGGGAGGGMGGPGGGGPPGGPGTGPSSSPSDAAASANYGRELSSARQADPAALASKIRDIKSAIGEIITQTLHSSPGVARAMSKTLQGLDAAMKEAAENAATLQLASPINASASSGAPASGGPAPVGTIGGPPESSLRRA